jgi:23S rRNA pseudouridine1911/1915/1917 synthase
MTTLRHATERNWPAARKALQPTLDEVVGRLLQEKERVGRQRGKARQPHADAGQKIISVHRLDRETSGLLVFARTRQAADALIEQFSAHTVDRVYQAIVVGHPLARRIATQLVRDRGDGLRGSTTEPTAGKPAVTHIRPLERIGDYSLLECRLETGRTHQIRIHLAEIGHPVCGDRKYAPRADVAIDDRSKHSGCSKQPGCCGPLALHAAELGFTHPRTGERVKFEMPMPKELQKFLDRLRAGATTADRHS